MGSVKTKKPSRRTDGGLMWGGRARDSITAL
ncbi:Uncharacterised protein [Pseudomonas fluorescens]|uniref:Uncharacterized protein n=1 Tax=Pseudomonas fluorescens TaxID=294 RepID=A0A379IJA3_PSEFL|nr:Uncharacterised protein [Pseudomonas fluorescens]